MTTTTKLSLAAGVIGLGLAFAVSTASASVVFLRGNHPQPDEENILFSRGSGSTVSGMTNISGTMVDFTTTTGQTLITRSRGQAKITTADNGGFITGISAFAPGDTFTDFIVNLHDLQSAATITVTANDGTFTDILAPRRGGDFITIIAQGGETISSVDFSSASGFNRFEQPRISGLAAAIPELSTWAMLATGFAGVGFLGMRRRTNRLAQVFD